MGSGERGRGRERGDGRRVCIGSIRDIDWLVGCRGLLGLVFVLCCLRG